jgi:hypothetical protein
MLRLEVALLGHGYIWALNFTIHIRSSQLLLTDIETEHLDRINSEDDFYIQQLLP